MTWTEMTENWHVALARLERRFPCLNRDTLAHPPETMCGLTRHIAALHDLTPLEADEAFADWIFVETLARTNKGSGLH
jgi:hypothetical protein